MAPARLEAEGSAYDERLPRTGSRRPASPAIPPAHGAMIGSATLIDRIFGDALFRRAVSIASGIARSFSIRKTLRRSAPSMPPGRSSTPRARGRIVPGCPEREIAKRLPASSCNRTPHRRTTRGSLSTPQTGAPAGHLTLIASLLASFTPKQTPGDTAHEFVAAEGTLSVPQRAQIRTYPRRCPARMLQWISKSSARTCISESCCTLLLSRAPPAQGRATATAPRVLRAPGMLSRRSAALKRLAPPPPGFPPLLPAAKPCKTLVRSN